MKNRLYKKSTKAALITISILCSVVMIIGFILTASYPMDHQTLFSKDITSYEDTKDFSNTIYSIAERINYMSANPYFNADGTYDREAKVDLYDFIFGENSLSGYRFNSELQSHASGKDPIWYRLGDLITWAERGAEDGLSTGSDAIIVCKRTDGFDYFTYNEFRQKIMTGDFQFSITSSRDDVRAEDMLLGLYNSNYLEGAGLSQQGDFKGIQDKDGKLLYVDCWNYDGNMTEELYAPLQEASLLEYVSHTASWNGNLSTAYDLLQAAIFSMQEIESDFNMFSTTYASENSNIRYFVADTMNKTIYSNNPAWKNYKDRDTYIKEISSANDQCKYVIYKRLNNTETNIKGIEDNTMLLSSPASLKTIAITIDTSYPVKDSFSNYHIFYERYRPLTLYMFYAAIACALLFLICLVILTIGAGRKEEDSDLHLMKWDRWFTELSAAGISLIWMCIAGCIFAGLELDGNLYNIVYYSNSVEYMMIDPSADLWWFLGAYGCLGAFTMIMFLTGYMSLVRRIKSRTLWKDSLLKRVWTLITKIFKNLNILWKLIVVSIIYLLLLFLATIEPYSPLILLPFIGAIGIFLYLLKFCFGQKKLVDEINIIAQGDVEHQIDTTSLTSVQKEQADAINRISEGLSIAIEKNLKSERMKTELITNVSHDLKTPLTSIINYVDLLKKENIENENAKKYLDILDQKSQQLKKLTEDVIEASKASSGAITLEKMNLDVVEFLSQCSGEFAEKFYAKHLILIENYPEVPVIINADGRRLWRTISNLYSNVAKYALLGSRVYADLETYDDKMVFTLKNISQNELNISADELTERFIRGDVSRTTEGSGLGLSIAKSLTELQGGTFDIYLDGDLFKVTITFPLV